jgi:leucyl/phenylalanyl-tRNA---protein transferase
MSLHLPRLGGDPTWFPPLDSALRRPDGLLAFGGDLSPVRLLEAYRRGIFPWYSEGQPILWWSPDPRAVFDTDGVHLATRFRRTLRGSAWTVRADTAFDAVIGHCAALPRPGQGGTWITDAMADAYAALHRLGHAHSIEVHDGDGALVGGLYGLAVGRMFFGESMFSVRSGGSKVALAALAARLRTWGWPLIDAQVGNPHLATLGARMLARDRFEQQVQALAAGEGLPGSWTGAFGELAAASLASSQGL